MAALVACALLVPAAAGAAPGQQQPPTSVLSAVANGTARPTLEWSLHGSSDQINVLPHLRCELGPAGSSPQFPQDDPCLWLVDHLAPPPTASPAGCVASREPDSAGPAPYASWRCDMRAFRDVVIHAAGNVDDRSFVMFNTTANGGSGKCATIPVTVVLGQGYGELQAADGCPQMVRCAPGYAGTVRSDVTDTVLGCPTGGGAQGGGGAPSDGGAPSGAPGSGGGAQAGGGASAAGGSSSSGSGGSSSRRSVGKQCPGASSGRAGNSPLYSVLIRPRGKRGMRIYVHMRRAVPITVDVRMRRGGGRTPKIVRWVARCAKKGTNVITLPNATGGAQQRRNYKVYVKSPNSTYPLRSAWEALPRR